jgi:hypothetical protein
MMKDVMIDIETLGTRSTSAIIQIGACYFDRDTGEIGQTFSVNIDYLVSTEPFTTDEASMQWWSEQSQEAKDAVSANGVIIATAIRDLYDFLDNDEVCIWSHATFDIPILLNAFQVLGLAFPIHHKKMRDIRTLMDLADHHGNPEEREGIHHNALDDCLFQVKYCVQAFNKLKK